MSQADIEQCADIRMIQRRNCARLAFKPIRELLRRNFDRHIAIQPRIARLPHFSHAAFTQQPNDFVGAEFRAGRERHEEDSA